MIDIGLLALFFLHDFELHYEDYLVGICFFHSQRSHFGERRWDFVEGKERSRGGFGDGHKNRT